MSLSLLEKSILIDFSMKNSLVLEVVRPRRLTCTPVTAVSLLMILRMSNPCSFSTTAEPMPSKSLTRRLYSSVLSISP